MLGIQHCSEVFVQFCDYLGQVLLANRGEREDCKTSFQFRQCLLEYIADSAQLVADKNRVGCSTPEYEEACLQLTTAWEGCLLSLWQTSEARQNEEASYNPHWPKTL